MLPEMPCFTGFLRPFFGSSSTVLRKNPLFSEADPKKTRSGPEEMPDDTGHWLPKPAKTCQNRTQAAKTCSGHGPFKNR